MLLDEDLDVPPQFARIAHRFVLRLPRLEIGPRASIAGVGEDLEETVNGSELAFRARCPRQLACSARAVGARDRLTAAVAPSAPTLN